MRILLLHKGGIGDVVFGLPLIRDLKHGFPGAELTVLTHSDGREVLEHSPQVDRLLCLSEERERWRLKRALSALAGLRFELAVSTVRSLRAAYLLWRSGAQERVGFDSGPERLFYTRAAPLRPVEVCFARRFQRLAQAAGAPAREELPRLCVSPARAEAARQRLRTLGWDGRQELLAVHAGGGWPTKRWPTGHLIAFARLAEGRLGARLVLQGGKEDGERAAAIVKETGALDTTGERIGEAIAQASLCVAAVGIDSGLSHAAAALGLPTVFLFGPNEPGSIALSPGQRMLTRPLSCRPCNRAGRRGCPERHHRCMEEHSPEEVAELLRSLLGEREASSRLPR